MKVVLAGDLFLGGDLSDKHCTSSVYSDTFRNADKRIVNLEQPISDNESLANKCTLYSGSIAAEQLKQLNVAAVNLAHNHIQDKLSEGILETIEHLDGALIGHFGAGKNIRVAKECYWLNDDVCLMGYCEYGRPYFRQIQVADQNSPGINPLRYESIISDLDQLPAGKKAILYFHWGREHVWFPPLSDIQLAKKLLEDARVILIVGMHCHRIQGFIEHCGKRAYMSLGNFLFPNFFIKPPTQIAYPEILPKNLPITRQYHSVTGLTYKKWHLVNRISLIVEYDTQNRQVRHIPMIQDDDVPVVCELRGIKKRLILLWARFLSSIYRLPPPIYAPLENINALLSKGIQNLRMASFYLLEKGPHYCGNKIIGIVKQKLNQ